MNERTNERTEKWRNGNGREFYGQKSEKFILLFEEFGQWNMDEQVDNKM